MTSTPSRFWPRFLWLMVGLVFCRGLMLLCVLPPFEGWDEYQHVAYIEHVRETGRRAVLWETSVSPALLAEVVKFPQPPSVAKKQLEVLGGVDYESFWARHDLRDSRRAPPAFRGGSTGLYQAQHSPLYYRLAAPLFSIMGGVDNLRWSVAGLRLANVGLTAAAVWVALGVLRGVVRRERDAALMGLALAAHPMFLMNGARVANDGLGVCLATVAVAAGLTLLTMPPTSSRRLILRALAIGLIVGLAVLAKATNFGLIPFAAFCWLAMAVRLRPGAGRAVLAGLAMAAGCFVVMQAELRFNLAHFGGLTSMQEAAINHRKGLTRPDLLHTAATFDWSRTVTRLWGRELFFTGGWSFLRSHPRAMRTYRDALTFGLLGWAWWAAAVAVARRRGRADTVSVFGSPWVPAACGVLVMSYTGALAYHMVQSKLAWGVSTTNPWYACPALPWFLAVAVAGGLCWPLGRWLRPAVPAALAGAGLVGELIGIWGRMVPTYTAGATGWEALSRLASLQPGLLGTATLASALAGEAVVVAALVLVWRDAVRDDHPEVGYPLLRRMHRPTTAAATNPKTSVIQRLR